MIEIKNISKVYKNGVDRSTVVNNVSLTINEGDFIAIVGQSGSGKSKLMHLIGGLDTPTDGEILYHGKDISKLKDKEIARYRRETIGFIFQDFNLDGSQTVLENIMMPMIFARVKPKERKERAMECLEKVNLIEKAHSKANQLSGGQQQRVAIARALINNPKILIADEPTGNLDTKSGQDIMALLKDLNKNGYTIIMVTHNVEQSYETDKIIKIRDGEIISIKNTDTDNKSLNESSVEQVEIKEDNI